MKILCKDPRIEKLLHCFPKNLELFLVGGVPRDYILKKKIKDLDLACKATLEEIKNILKAANIKTIDTGATFVTLTSIPIKNLEPVQISSFRQLDKNGKTIQGGDLLLDLSLRDFTMNALALNCRTGKIIDPFKGRKDIEKKLIRCPENPELRFMEDPLRILRMARFSAALDFQVQEDTFRAACKISHKIKSLSSERIRDELCKLLMSEDPTKGFTMLEEIGALKEFFPELSECVGFEQNNYHKDELFTHTLEVLSKTPAILELRLAALMHDIGKPASLSVDETGMRHFYRHDVIGEEITAKIMLRLKFSKKLTDDVKTLVRLHMKPTTMGDAGMRRLIRNTANLFPLWRQLVEADSTSCMEDPKNALKRLAKFDEHANRIIKELREKPLKLKINGKDLLSLGIPQGPQIGTILNLLREKVLKNPDLNQKEVLLEIAKQTWKTDDRA